MEDDPTPPVPPSIDELFAYASEPYAFPTHNNPSHSLFDNSFGSYSPLLDDNLVVPLDAVENAVGSSGYNFTTPDGRPAETFEAFTASSESSTNGVDVDKWGAISSDSNLLPRTALSTSPNLASAAIAPVSSSSSINLGQPGRHLFDALSPTLRPRDDQQTVQASSGQPSQVLTPADPIPGQETATTTQGPSEKWQTMKHQEVLKGHFLDDFDGFMLKMKNEMGELARKHGKKPEVVEHMVFNGGPNYMKTIKPNVWNAWSHFKYEAVNAHLPTEARMPLAEVQKTYGDEYKALTSGERDDFVRRYTEWQRENRRAPRGLSRGKVQDVNNTCEKIIELMLGLASRSGIIGMFCIARASSSFGMTPRWFFTDAGLDKFLEIVVTRWNIASIGTKMEVFGLADGNVHALLKTAKEKANYLRDEIRMHLQQGLDAAVGKENVRIFYPNFYDKITVPYHVDIVNWPPGIKFVNPSELSDALDGLRTLRDALVTKTCRFVKLTDAEFESLRQKVEADREAGVVPPRVVRKKRTGTNKQKKAAHVERESNEEVEEEESHEDAPRKRKRT
ncbi:hypothetical protein BC629DRAFT_526011 [Irpex lacteus]|nr:hypothetical protein BC629DRAFT_526011 [Irpex lacteus]